MNRLRRRSHESVQPAPGTILPGVPLVGRDAGDLIPQQRVHDPLSSADRAGLAVHGSEPNEPTAPAPTVREPEPIDAEQVPLEDEPVGDLEALGRIDDGMLAQVVKRRPVMPVLRGPGVDGARPAPERLKLMVGVLARDFERFGNGSTPPATAHRLDHLPEPTGPVVAWGPWPEPHTAAWPVVVPPWGALPRSFAAPLPASVTRSA